MVADPYLSLLDGVQYVEAHGFDQPFEFLNVAFQRAEKLARELDLELVPTQIYGHDIRTPELCTSFMRDSWRKAPGSPAWGSLPLIFDRRDQTREIGVARQLLRRGTGKPYVVVALSGTSSPFEHNLELLRYARAKLSHRFDLIDVSGYTAPRFYDLLTLLEGAEALLTVDSGLLHLAHAVPGLKVFAFITREPSKWHGSPWRAQHYGRYFYDEAPECFSQVVEDISNPWRPRIHHVWSHYGPIEPETARRIAFAQTTWQAEYGLSRGMWHPCEYKASDVKRDSSGDGINDPRPVAFMRDAINHAAGKCGSPDDIIAFTNADVSFCPGLTGWVVDICGRHGAAFTHRWDYHLPLTEPLVNEAQVKLGEWYAGSDAFFFTLAWWRRHAWEYPDMLVGREQNDEVLRQLIKRTGGLEIRDAIYHEKHPSYWEHHGNRKTNPGNKYNQRLAKKFFLRTGLGPNDPWWWQLPK